MKHSLKSISHSINYHKILFYLSVLVDLLFIVLLILNYFNYLPVFWSGKILYFFFLILAINTIYLALRIKAIPEDKRNDSLIVFFSKYFFLLLLIVITVNQFLKREIIIQLMPEITGIAIALGFLTFYAHKNRVETELENEKINEDEKTGAERFKNLFLLF